MGIGICCTGVGYKREHLYRIKTNLKQVYRCYKCRSIPERAQAESPAAVPEREEPVEGGGY